MIEIFRPLGVDIAQIDLIGPVQICGLQLILLSACVNKPLVGGFKTNFKIVSNLISKDDLLGVRWANNDDVSHVVRLLLRKHNYLW